MLIHGLTPVTKEGNLKEIPERSRKAAEINHTVYPTLLPGPEISMNGCPQPSWFITKEISVLWEEGV